MYPATLEANLLTFARQLRAAGMLVGLGEVSLALKALDAIDVTDKAEARSALASIFAKSPLERRRFARLFDLYFSAAFFQGEATPEQDMTDLKPPQRKKLQSVQMLDWSAGSDSKDQLDTMGYSPDEARADDERIRVQSGDLDKLEKLVRRLAKQLATLASRRHIMTLSRGNLTDLRRTIRRNLAHGGEPLELSYKRRKITKIKLVFLFDVSGSMMVYSQFLLQLAYALVRQRRLGRTEVFGFSTDMYRLTEQLRYRSVEEALRAAQLAMPGRAGGTKIGATFQYFIERHSALLGPKTVLVIVSDGWDTGDLDLLRRAMKTFKERCNRVIWLNPLAASPGYEPTVAGMRTALPYIDTFAPAHNLESLSELVVTLRRDAP